MSYIGKEYIVKENQKDNFGAKASIHISASSRYRNRVQIIASILEAANDGNTTKTKIMYKAFLSYSQLEEYLPILVENELLKFYENHSIFHNTEKGRQFIEIYNEISEYYS